MSILERLESLTYGCPTELKERFGGAISLYRYGFTRKAKSELIEIAFYYDDDIGIWGDCVLSVAHSIPLK